MKGKFYAFGVLGLFGLFAAGIIVSNKYYEPTYQTKDYSHFLRGMGLADGAAEFHWMIRADENGNIDPKDVAASRRNVARHETSKGAANWMFWKYAGPNFVGGRTRGLIRDNQPGNEKVFYAGAVAGGVFVTYNSGTEWHDMTGDLSNLNVSDLAQTPNGTLFVGTGPGHESNSGINWNTGGFAGDGLFRRSEDGNGNSVYTRIEGPPSPGAGGWSTINRILSHPTENKIYVGTGGGLQVSANAMDATPAFFNPVKIGGAPHPGKVDDILVSKEENGVTTIYVAYSGSRTLYKLKDNGGEDITVEKSIELPANGNGTVRRITLAMSPQDNNIIYAAAANPPTQTGGNELYGVYQSKDGGDTWNTIGTKGPGFDPFCQLSGTQCQGNYDQAIAVSPNDPGRLIVGAVSLWRWDESKTNPGTGGWTKMATTSGGSSGGLLDTNYVHADKHRIFYTDSLTIYVASDGGIGKSIDGGRTWSQNNNGYSVTQFYTVDAAFGADTSIGELIMGGTQDNGTQVVGFFPSRPTDPREITGGDGFSCNFSNIAGLAFSSLYNGSIFRLRPPFSYSRFYDSELEGLNCNTSGCGPFFTRFNYWEIAYAEQTKDSIKMVLKDTAVSYKQGDTLIYPSNLGGVPMFYETPVDLNFGDSIMLPDYGQSKFVLAVDDADGSKSIYMTRDAANLNTINYRWDLIANDEASKTYPDEIDADIFKMSFSPDGNQLYAGTTSGGLFRIDNLNQGYDSLTLDVRSPQCVLTCTKIAQGLGVITSIAVDPNDANNLVITSGGYQSGTKIRRITNASTAPRLGANAQSIMGDFPKNVPVYASVIAVHDKNTVVVGCDYGIYATDEAFNNPVPDWYFSYGIPRSAVFQLKQQSQRYLWNKGPKIENSFYKTIYAGTHSRGFYKTTSLVGLEDDKGDDGKVVNKVDPVFFSIYPNPMNNRGYIDVTLPEDQNVTIEIYDLSGKRVSEVHNGRVKEGKNKIEFSAADLRNGTYIATMRTNDELKVSKFVVIK